MKFAYVFVALFALFAFNAYNNKAQAQSFDPCTACELVCELAEYYIQFENLNATQIEQYLNNACALFPSVESECEAVVALYLDTIITQLVAGSSPQQICSGLGLCSSSKPIANVVKNNFAKIN